MATERVRQAKVDHDIAIDAVAVEGAVEIAKAMATLIMN